VDAFDALWISLCPAANRDYIPYLLLRLRDQTRQI
jgi:hypothetical protein